MKKFGKIDKNGKIKAKIVKNEEKSDEKRVRNRRKMGKI